MMILLPPQSFTIDTKLKTDQVLEQMKIHSQTEYDRGFFGRTYERYFIGYVRHDSFTVSRATSMRNYVPPFLEGRILPTVTGSKVEIAADYTTTQKFFFIGIMAVVIAVFFLPWILNQAEEQDEFLPILAFCFMLLFFYVSFVIEVILARRKLIEILSGQLRDDL